MRRGEDLHRGVVVLGMHRSGTSATAGALVRLGLSPGTPETLKGASRVNEAGFYEQRPLTRFNETLLQRLGGTWAGPPELGSGWERSADLAEERTEATRLFRETFPEEPWVWKDPRTCLTLPFWIACLDARAVALLVLRNPLDIASSLHAREGVTEPHALALWERSMRAGLLAAEGLPVLVTEYQALIQDPEKWATTAGTFLGRHGISTAENGPGLVEEFVDPRLRHHERVDRDLAASPSTTAAQTELAAVLGRLVGEHDALIPPELPLESPSTPWLLAERRRADAEARELRSQIKELRRRAGGKKAASKPVDDVAQPDYGDRRSLLERLSLRARRRGSQSHR